MWTITGFADEVGDDFAEQLDLMAKINVKFIEFRSAWGVRVLDLDDDQLRQAKQMLDDAGVQVSAVGTDLGKIKITDDFGPHLERTKHACEVARFLGADALRGFSFFIPEGESADDYRDEVLSRLHQMVEVCEQAGINYLHENEKDIYGDIPARCADLRAEISSPNFSLILDPANYVQCDVHPFEAYQQLKDDIIYVHVKDALFADDSVVPAGEGDGQWPQIIDALNADGYDGFFSIEPHLGAYNEYGADTGPELWQKAHDSFVALLDERGIAHG